MAILVTRPAPDGKALCDALSASGFQVVYQPLIEFSQGRDSEHLLDTLRDSDFVIAVSKPAVEWANKVLHSKMQNWPITTRYFAIGQITADKLSEVSAQKVHYPQVSDSEHLLQLPQLLESSHSKVTILRGNGGRELIHDALLKRGAIVKYCEVYQRKELLFDGLSSVKSWQANEVTHIVLTSGEQLNYFFSMIPQSEYDWLFKQQVIVPSSRISDMAYKLGFHKIMVSGSASNPDLVAVIQQLCTTG